MSDELWSHVEADLHHQYGIDIEDTALLAARSWRWLLARIFGLLATDCATSRAVLRKHQPPTR